jgi:LRR-repeat protein 1
MLAFLFQLKGNIQQCFTKFVNEGKATVRFTEPPHDVCLSKVRFTHL